MTRGRDDHKASRERNRCRDRLPWQIGQSACAAVSGYETLLSACIADFVAHGGVNCGAMVEFGKTKKNVVGWSFSEFMASFIPVYMPAFM